MLVDISECKDNMFHLNGHQREHFNNQVDRTIYSVGISQHFSSAIPIIGHWTQKQNGHDVRDGGYACI